MLYAIAMGQIKSKQTLKPTGHTREQCEKALCTTIDDVNLMKCYSMHHFFAFLQLALWTLDESRLRQQPSLYALTRSIQVTTLWQYRNVCIIIIITYVYSAIWQYFYYYSSFITSVPEANLKNGHYNVVCNSELIYLLYLH